MPASALSRNLRACTNKKAPEALASGARVQKNVSRQHGGACGSADNSAR